MRKYIFVLSVLFCFSFGIQTAEAQSYKDPVSYMSYITEQYREIMKNYLSYTSAVAHGKSARKVDGLRVSLLQSVQASIKNVKKMPDYEGNTALRDSAVSFLTITFYVLNDDYAKIVNMEEIAEQSYDAMEAYLLAQDIAGDKMERANESLQKVQKEYAAQHNITLVDSKDEISTKMEQAAKVNAYHRVLYLIFFKSYKQEGYMTEAIQKKDMNAIEQNRNTLIKYTDEGLAKLDTMKAFNGDRSMIVACQNMLKFYKDECTTKVPGMTDYYMKDDNFKKIKKAFDEKPEKDRTQADVDQYNKGVNDLNAAVGQYNTTIEYLNVNRGKYINEWNNASQGFMDKQMPKYK